MKKLLIIFIISILAITMSSCVKDEEPIVCPTGYHLVNDRCDLDEEVEPLVCEFGFHEEDGVCVENVTEEYNHNLLTLTGFASRTVTGISGVTETSDAYALVTNELEFVEAIEDTDIKVIEIANDLDMGYNEVSDDVRSSSVFGSHNIPLMHPVLIESGVSKITIERDGAESGLIIFSRNGAKITHTSIVIERSQNIIIRNLEFDELWEWDEATGGEYDRNDWDYITIKKSDGVWIDHCTFGKAYDGLIDVKEGSKNVTISWSVFRGNAAGDDPFLVAQFDKLEEDKESYPMYNNFRSQGMTQEDITKISGGQKKGHLVGSSEFAEGNEDFSITLAYNHYIDVMDRLPRLREGNAHVFNIFVDSEEAYNSYQILNNYTNVNFNGYKLSVTSQAFVTTEGGALLVENSYLTGVRTPIKNNQKSSLDPDFTGKYRIDNTRYVLGATSVLSSSNEEDTPFVGNTSVINFTWNMFDQLPYTFTMVEPDEVVDLVTNETSGAGSGVLTMTFAEWLSINYDEE